MFAVQDRFWRKVERLYRCTASSIPFRTFGIFAETRECRPFAFSALRTILPAEKRQPSYFQRFPHSSIRVESLTPAFPLTSTALVRPLTKERKSTPVFSVACGLFWRNGGSFSEFAKYLNHYFKYPPTQPKQTLCNRRFRFKIAKSIPGRKSTNRNLAAVRHY